MLDPIAWFKYLKKENLENAITVADSFVKNIPKVKKDSPTNGSKFPLEGFSEDWLLILSGDKLIFEPSSCMKECFKSREEMFSSSIFWKWLQKYILEITSNAFSVNKVILEYSLQLCHDFIRNELLGKLWLTADKYNFDTPLDEIQLGTYKLRKMLRTMPERTEMRINKLEEKIASLEKDKILLNKFEFIFIEFTHDNLSLEEMKILTERLADTITEFINNKYPDVEKTLVKKVVLKLEKFIQEIKSDTGEYMYKDSG